MKFNLSRTNGEASLTLTDEPGQVMIEPFPAPIPKTDLTREAPAHMPVYAHWDTGMRDMVLGWNEESERQHAANLANPDFLGYLPTIRGK